MDLPLLVSFPRSGSHWIGGLLELYLNQKRVLLNRPNVKQLSLLDEKVSEVGFSYTHDWRLSIDIPASKCVYLYRNPVHVLFSLYQVRLNGHPRPELVKGGVEQQVPNMINYHGTKLKNHLEKWLLAKNVLSLKYEDFSTKTDTTLKLMCKHMGFEFDLPKAKIAESKISKEKLIIKAKDINMTAYFNSTMVTAAYENERNNFEQKYGDQIRNLVITNPIDKFFKN